MYIERDRQIDRQVDRQIYVHQIHQVETHFFSYYIIFLLSSKLSDLCPWSLGNLRFLEEWSCNPELWSTFLKSVHIFLRNGYFVNVTIRSLTRIRNVKLAAIHFSDFVYMILWSRTQVRKLRRKKKDNVIAKQLFSFDLVLIHFLV